MTGDPGWRSSVQRSPQEIDDNLACDFFHKRVDWPPVMQPESGPGREIGEGYKYVSLGMTFAGGTILFMAAGFWLDRWLGLLPLFTIVGTLAGATLSFLNVYRKLKVDEAEHEQDRLARKRRHEDEE